MFLILIILFFLALHVLSYRYLKINLINIYIIFFFNLCLIAFLYYSKYSFATDYIFLIVLSFNSFIFCYAIFFTGVIDDSPTLKIIYFLYFKNVKNKKDLQKKFIKSGSIKFRIIDLFKNSLLFHKSKKKYNLTKLARILVALIIFIEKSLKLKSDV